MFGPSAFASHSAERRNYLLGLFSALVSLPLSGERCTYEDEDEDMWKSTFELDFSQQGGVAAVRCFVVRSHDELLFL